MLIDATPHRFSVIDRLDPRVRTGAAIATSLFPLFLLSWLPLLTVLGASVGLVAYERIAWRGVLKRLMVVNGFMAMLVAVLPWSVPGEALWSWGSFAYSQEGLAQAGHITARSNAIVLILTAFIGTMEPTAFAHSLQRLGMPHRLAVLFTLTIRYIAVLETEYLRLRQAMRARNFTPRMDRHTLRSLGFLVGMLIVRAYDRSERVREAMICRGFTGRFHTHRHMRVGGVDRVFATVLVLALGAVAFLEWG